MPHSTSGAQPLPQMATAPAVVDLQATPGTTQGTSALAPSRTAGENSSGDSGAGGGGGDRMLRAVAAARSQSAPIAILSDKLVVSIGAAMQLLVVLQDRKAEGSLR